MAVDFGKLNKAGLGASSFGARKTTGTSAQATRNLQNSTVATKSSLFSFKGSPKTNWVPGQHVSKGQHQYNYQGMRASLNGASGARRTYAPAFHGPVGNAGMPNVKVNNDMAKGFMTGQAIMMGMGLLNQLGVLGGGSGVSASSLGDKLSNALGSLGGGSSAGTAVASTISSMENATDSATLRSALAEASGQLSSLNAQTSGLETAAEDAKKNIDGLKSDVKTKEKGLKDANQTLKNANSNVDIAKTAKDSAQNKLENANNDYREASQAHTQAKANTATKQTALNQAEATLKATPEYVKDADGNLVKNDPAYSNALEARDKAKEELEQAKTDEKAAADAESKAKDVQNQASAEAKDAAQKLKDAEDKLDKAEKAKESAEKAKTKAEEELKNAEEALNKAEGAIEKLKEHEEDVKDLSKAITKQQERLQKMEKEENEDYNKLTDKINSSSDKNAKRAAKIDTSDGMNLIEKIRHNRMERTNEKNERRLDEKENLSPLVQDNNFIKDLLAGKHGAPTVVNGENFYTGTTPSGQTVFYRGNQPISEEEFKAATGVGV